VQPGQPSRTSILVAAARAFGAREPDASVRNPDYLAERLLGPRELQLIADHPIASALKDDYRQARQRFEVAGISNLLLARTRYIDEHLERALESGTQQVVILGAGFDTRAYRFQDLLAGRKVFEVDHGPTQELKKRRVAEVLGRVPENVEFVEIDFRRNTLREALRGAGYRTGEKTFFIWEGVSMYIAEDAVRETLRTIAACSPAGSMLVMDFAGMGVIEFMQKFPHLSQHRHTTGWGEPWIFGLPDGRERQFFAECGLDLREIMRLYGGEVSRRYLTRADGTRLGPRRARRTREASDKTSALTRFMRTTRILFAVAGLLRRKSNWYALAVLVTPERT
jgi:methyltransferase (TIGR00027 family)